MNTSGLEESNNFRGNDRMLAREYYWSNLKIKGTYRLPRRSLLLENELRRCDGRKKERWRVRIPKGSHEDEQNLSVYSNSE